MFLIAVLVVLAWLCGSVFAVSLCWASSRGDERELAAAQEILAQRAARARVGAREERPLALV